VERDPTTFAEIRRYPHITLDGLFVGGIVLPDYNAFAYGTLVGPDRFGVRTLPLDPSRPSEVPWLAGACLVDRVADGRAAISRGTTCSNEETQRLLELRDAHDGRLLASVRDGYVSAWAATRLIVAGDRLIDPLSGEEMPEVPGWVVTATGSRAITRLGDGGAALMRLDTAPAPRSLGVDVVAQATCTWPDFAHVAPADLANIRCSELTAAAGPHRLVVSPGRQPTAATLTINSLEMDPTRRVITIHYAQTATSHWAGPTAEVAILAVPQELTGEWLVWTVTDQETPSDYAKGGLFDVRLP
jgi:hypothetical protein